MGYFEGQTRKFNETIDVDKLNFGNLDIDFTCNGIAYQRMYSGNGDLYFRQLDESGKITNDICVYRKDTGWTDEIYRTITINGGKDTSSNDYFLLMMGYSTDLNGVPPVYYTLRIDGVETNVYKGQVLKSIVVNETEYLIKETNGG